MKITAGLALLFIMPLMGFSQKKLSGNWRETKRSNLQGATISFQDTIKVSFLPGNEYTWFKKGGFIYRGTYKLEKNDLDMGSRFFHVLENSNKHLVLSDEDAQYTFEPFEEAPVVKLAGEPAPVPVQLTASIVGIWKVFKGTSASKIKELDLSNRIKTVVFFAQPDEFGDVGYISGGKDMQGQPSWKMSRLKDGTLYCHGKSDRAFFISQTGDELLLKEGDQSFFLKQFKE
ncbi:MAG: hypothetical protein JSS64_11975 [Bacteroidetes bacterium]|nr:hypothetical protein [Bacteroidota bacterium]